LIRLVVALVCLLPLGIVHAQSNPFESSMRGSVGTGLGQQPMARGGTFIPRVDSAVQYAYNLNLVEQSSDRVDTWGLELAPGFYASYLSGTVTAAIDYSIQGRVWGESDLDDVGQIGAANGRWTAVPDLFFVDAQGNITQSPINASAGINYGQIGIFGQDNLSEQATASIAPTLARQFGQYDFFAQYAYGGVWYFDQGSQADRIGFIGNDNSRNQNATVSVGNQDSGRKLTGQLEYDWQRTTYDNALPYNYEQLSLDLSWEMTRTTALVGEYGIESDLDKSTTDGGLDSSFWNAGLRWQPDSRTYAEARYGDRFFGHTYYLNMRRTARILEFEASYSESPEVDSQILSLGSFTPGELPPIVDPGTNVGRLNSQPYVAKNSFVQVRAVGSRTTAGLRGFQNVQDFIGKPQELVDLVDFNAQYDQTVTGVMLWVSRDLAANLSTDFWGAYTEYEQTQIAREGTEVVLFPANYNDLQFFVRLNRDSSGGKLVTSAEAGYLDRTGSQNYDGWWVAVRARWYP
jgi:hypothetical protein